MHVKPIAIVLFIILSNNVHIFVSTIDCMWFLFKGIISITVQGSIYMDFCVQMEGTYIAKYFF